MGYLVRSCENLTRVLQYSAVLHLVCASVMHLVCDGLSCKILQDSYKILQGTLLVFRPSYLVSSCKNLARILQE